MPTRMDRRPCTWLVVAAAVCCAPAAWAAAPARPGQPYAESSLCAQPDVIFCEDFDVPANFACTGAAGIGNHKWTNPGFVAEVNDYVYGCEGRQINPASDYPAHAAGSAGSVWVANWNPAQGAQSPGSSWGVLRQKGGAFANGVPASRDVYVRFQIYWTPNYAWPGDPKTDLYGWGASNPVDNKILFLYPPEFQSPTEAAYDCGLYTQAGAWDNVNNARFADALSVRVGDSGSGTGYEFFPMCANCSANPPHMEYAPYQTLALSNPNDTPTPGKMFRFSRGRWYTVELRYRLSSAPGALDGTIEVWVEGTKVYSASDLRTCGNGTPADDCSGLGQIYLGAYHNAADGTVWNGQQVVDNLVISKSYIGPPGDTGDAGTSNPDAGGSGSDGGSPASDGGASGTDAGVDAGIGLPDGGGPAATGDGGSPAGEVSANCGCTSSSPRSAAAALAAAALAGLARSRSGKRSGRAR